MKRSRLAALAVAAAAAAIIVYKVLAPEPSTPTTPPVVSGAGPDVLLFADPGEAGSACGCGQIIRLVRDAGGQGIAVREIPPGSDPALERRHRVTVAPTFLVLDERGEEIARHEGESPETVEAIRQDLVRLEGSRR